jgi:hypothetical protein
MEHDVSRTSSLTEIRDFLRSQQVAAPPWSAPPLAVEALYALLERRRDDGAFWARLKDLAARLDDRRFRASLLGQADVLGGATLDRLLDDLRDGIGLTSRRGSAPRGLAAPALLAFLVLGAAAGCDTVVESDESGTDTGRSCEDEASDLGMSAHETDVYCELVDLVKGADIPSEERDVLLDCLPGLDAAYRESLLDSWKGASEEGLLAMLDELAGPCSECTWEEDCDDH